MDRVVFQVLAFLLWSTISVNAYCPSLCVCKTGKQSDDSTLTDFTDWLKLRCGGPENPISELKELSLGQFSDHIVILNLSGNVISTLSRELHLPKLQKLDLSKNQISLIESDAFYNLTSLQKLDLSNNQISTIYKEIFKGLINLERLSLAQNNIETIASGTFDYLMGLKHLDISNNPLRCDCGLLWLNEWLLDHASVKLTGMPKCASPSHLKGQLVKKLKTLLDLTQCGAVLELNKLIVRPQNGQVVFAGDSISLSCRTPYVKPDSDSKLFWTYPLSANISSFNATNIDAKEDGVADTKLSIESLSRNHTGNWTCHFEQEPVRLIHQIEIVVIDAKTKFCPTSNTINNRGSQSWPIAFLNRTVQVPCGSRLHETATRFCNGTGFWTNLNTSACPYANELTKMLQQMAVLNTSIARDSVDVAASRLLTLLTKDTAQDADDVMFIQKAIYNYMQHAKDDTLLALTLLRVIERTMSFPASVIIEAEKRYESATKLTQAVEILSKYTLSVQLPSIAVERIGIVKDKFNGMTCTWYIQNQTKKLNCTNSSPSLQLIKDSSTVFAMLTIPPTFLYGMDKDSQVPPNKMFNMIVSMYENASLFPLLPALDDREQRGHRSKDFYGISTKRDDINLDIVSPVVGISLENVSSEWHLNDPMYVAVRAVSRGGREAAGPGARPALYFNNWTNHTQYCEFSEASKLFPPDMVLMSCYRLGHVGLLRNVETGYYGGRTYASRFKFSHPAIYVGGLVLIICLTTVILTYIACYDRIRMGGREKHALVNTNITILVLCLIYSLGVYQTEDARLCRILGLLLHYLLLSSLFWQVGSAGDLYSAARKVHVPSNSQPRPATDLYLIGWGIPILVCAVTGAVDLSEYAAQSQCFLSHLPFLSALLLPAGIALLILIILLGLTAKALGSEATAEARKLRAQVAISSAYLCACISAAGAVYRPFPSYLPYQEDMSSIVYAVSTSVLGTFVLFFYGISRADVRDQWSALRWRDPPKRPKVLRGPPSDKSDLSKDAVLHLNGHTNGKVTPHLDSDLMELHRRQYRSDDSTTDDSHSKVFYNPNQIEMARKFFRRQRRNVEGNILELMGTRRTCEEVTDSDVRQNDSSRNGDVSNRDGWDESASIRSHGLYPPAPHPPSIALSAV